jgi:GH24 family phage-related lysozyme (muramidase)
VTDRQDQPQRTIHPDGVALIKEFEGLRLGAYRDTGGIWTIGYGHTGPDVTPGLRINSAQAERLLLEDIGRFAALVDQAVTAPINEHQRAALVSLVFNVGPGRKGPGGRSGIITLADGRPSTLLRRLNAGDYAGAAQAFGAWVFAGGQRLEGLVRRRKAERALFEGGA